MLLNSSAFVCEDRRTFSKKKNKKKYLINKYILLYL
nr:MAG TPA: hypothetical protein [Caudoviricetes sp.]